MTDSELIALIEQYSEHCYGASTQGNLSVERANAIARYNTEPWGDEVDGRSQLISSVVRDTVEEAIPQLLRIFLGGDETVKFDPLGPEDVAQAETETQYCNWIIQNKNPAFQIFSTWFRDALLCKNGYVMATWEKRDDIKLETYKGLPDDAYALIQADKAVQIAKAEAYPDPTGTYPQVWDVEVRRLEPSGYVKIDTVPGEEIRVHISTRDVNLNTDCLYVEHRREQTLSEVRQMGYQVPDDFTSTPDGDNGQEALARDRFNEQEYGGESSDPAAQRVLFRHIWMRVDRDGDGIAELRRVCMIDKTILHEEETDLIPIACLTPIIQPHRHVGYGYYDFLREIESAATAMLRAYFDNVYLANNGRYGVNVDNVNIDDMLISKPGGLVRVKGMPGDNIFPLTHSTNGDTALNALQFLENWKKQATGVMSDAQSLSSDVLSKAPMGSIAQVISVWQARVEGVARAFAETGVKELFRIVHALSNKNATASEKIKINDQWAAVDPREWVKRTNLTVTVGLGTGSKESKVAFLQQLGQMQAAGMPMGIAGPKNIYESAMELMKEMGYKDGARFWMNPELSPPPEPQKDPLVQAEEVKGQVTLQAKQMDGQLKAQEFRAKGQADEVKMRQDAMLKQFEIEKQAELERFKIEQQMILEKYKADLAAQTELQKTHVLAGAQVDASYKEQGLDYKKASEDKKAREDTDRAIAENINELHAKNQELDGALRVERGGKEIVRDGTGRIVGAMLEDGTFRQLERDETGRGKRLKPAVRVQ